MILSHLLVPSLPRHAITWGNVSVVGLSWLTDCVRFGVRQDESAHPPPLLTSEPNSAPTDQPKPQYTANAQKDSNENINVNNNLQPEQQGRPETAANHSKPGPISVTNCEGPGDINNQTALLSPHSHLDTPPYFYLSWVRLLLVGCNREETKNVVGLTCECGAVREPEIHPEITHVIVGSEPTPSQLVLLRDHLAIWTHCLPVKINWLQVITPFTVPLPSQSQLSTLVLVLQHCVTLGRHVEARGTSWTLPSSALTPNLAPNLTALEVNPQSHPMGSGSLLARAPSVASIVVAGGGAGVGSGGGPALNSDAPAPSASLSHPAPGSSNVRGTLLKGLYFTLAAVIGTEEERVGNQLIIVNGGKVFTASNVSKAPPNPELGTMTIRTDQYFTSELKLTVSSCFLLFSSFSLCPLPPLTSHREGPATRETLRGLQEGQALQPRHSLLAKDQHRGWPASTLYRQAGPCVPPPALPSSHHCIPGAQDPRYRL